MTRIYAAILIVVSMSFAGCLDIFIDVVQYPDHTFALCKTMGVGDNILRQMHDMMHETAQADSVSGHPDKNMDMNAIRDTMLAEFRNKIAQSNGRSRFMVVPGITDVRQRDTTIDTMTYFTTELDLANIAALPEAYNALLSASEYTKDMGSATLKHSKTGTTVTFRLKNSPTPKEPLMDDIWRFRVLTPRMGIPSDNSIKVIPGGQECSVNFKRASDSRKWRSISFRVLK